MKTQTTPTRVRVAFRTWRDDHPGNPSWSHGDITAVFPDLFHNEHLSDARVCYAHVGQHASCHAGFLDDERVRPSTPEEYGDLLAELRRIYETGYPGDPAVRLEVVDPKPVERPLRLSRKLWDRLSVKGSIRPA